MPEEFACLLILPDKHIVFVHVQIAVAVAAQCMADLDDGDTLGVVVAIEFQVQGVKRRPIFTPDRRPILTP